MSPRLEMFSALLVCVVLFGCGTKSDEEADPADSNANATPTSQGDDVASADRLSEWVVPGDDVAQQNAGTSAPPADEESPWAIGDEAEQQNQDAVSPQDVGADVSTAGDDATAGQGPSFDEYFSRVNDLVGNGDITGAVKLAQEAYTKTDDPRTARLLVNLSVFMVQRRDVDGALAVLEKLKETSDNQDVSTMLFQVYYLKSQNASDDEAALAYMQKSTEILRGLDLDQPEVANFFYREAVLLGKNQQGEQAVASLREALEQGYAEITTAEEAFADNEAALKIIDEFSGPIRERLREDVRTQIADNETFPFGFELTTVDGETVISTEELKGKVVIVDLWGTWCPPCREEIPHFVKLLENYSENLAIVGVNFENGDTNEEKTALVNEFITANGVTYPCVLATDSLEKQVPDIEGFPTTIFMGKDGTVRLKVVGYQSYDKLEAIIRELMDEAPAA